MISGIYAIKNNVNGKLYIGSTKSFIIRLKQHKSKLRHNVHCNNKLQHSWNKYGESSFEFIRLIICDIDNLLMYEQRAIDIYDSVKNGYNINPNAKSPLGIKMSDDEKEKRSKTLSGRKLSKEHKKNISIAKKKMGAERIKKALEDEKIEFDKEINIYLNSIDYNDGECLLDYF